MTTTTPPGWYPEPGHTGSGPAMERWWDGAAWTEYTRTAPAPAAGQQVYPGYPGYPGDQGYAQGYGQERGKRTGTVVLAIVGALVLIGGIVAGVLVLGKDDGKDKAGPTKSPTHSGGRSGAPAPPTDGGNGGGDNGGGTGGGDDGGTGGDQGRGDGTKAVDAYDAISLPLLTGWKGGPTTAGAGVTTGDYTCPGSGDTGTCSLAGAFSMPAASVGIKVSSPEAAAKQDVSKNAAESYSADTYGATTSHQQLKAAAVTVAGQHGYMVRWKVVTASGTQGYVESLVFPSPTTKQLVLVRFGFDVNAKAPGTEVMDQIAQGIKSDTSQGAGTTGGTGTGV